MSAIAFIVAAFVAITKTSISGWDYIGTVVAGFLFYGVVVLAKRVEKEREEFEVAA